MGLLFKIGLFLVTFALSQMFLAFFGGGGGTKIIMGLMLSIGVVMMFD